ncbi:MAG: NUDIX hydrolase [Acidimicrobiales bacterium]|jgi:8-oxo-dGTP diphosphatase
MTTPGPLPDRTPEYRTRDLHAEGEWPLADKPRYGGAIFDGKGRILLREPSGHYGGYHWTFPKGRPEVGEHPSATALRETLEETGHRPVITGHLPGVFRAGPRATSNYFYLMEDRAGLVDPAALATNQETADLRWATRREARELINLSPNDGGRRRDLEVLDAAFDEHDRTRPGPTQESGAGAAADHER